MIPNDPAGFIRSAHGLADEIEKKKDLLISLLCQYESYDTACDEISRSCRTLKGFSTEFRDLDHLKKYYAISTFFPINLPLYSFVLFAVAPSAFSKKVFVRPPLTVANLIKNVLKIIKSDLFFGNIEIHSSSRKEFLKDCVNDSQAVIFNGRYENVQELIRHYPYKTFIYNGRGVNPAIVGKNADIDLAVDKIIEMRVYNSGQDCAGVDAIFVSEDAYDSFVTTLRRKIAFVYAGNYNDPKVQIGKMQRPEYINELRDFLRSMDDSITLRGKIDLEKNIVTAFIIEREITEHTGDFPEFFGPIFYILRYSNDSELLNILNTPFYSDYAMYASTFGTSTKFNLKIPNSRVLVDKIINDVEIGNEAYGGYGPKANFIYKNNCYEARPILISQELPT